MFYFTRTVDLPDGTEVEVDFTADDDGNVDSDDPEADIAAAQAYWANEGWQQAEQDAADEYGDYKYEQRRDDRMMEE